MTKINRVNFVDPEELRYRINFDNLTPLYPQERIVMEHKNATPEDMKDLTPRIIVWFARKGKDNARWLWRRRAPGKTVMLKNIAHAIEANYPDAHLIMLLIDERPEEVTIWNDG